MFKGRRTAKSVLGREDVAEAFVTSTEGTGWSDLQAQVILSHTGPQVDPAARVMDRVIPTRERGRL